MCKLPSLISGGGEVTAPEYHFICPIVFTSHSPTWLCSPLTTLSPLAAARPGEMWGFEGEREVRGEREEEQAQTKTQIWSVEDYILLAWALLMEAQISSNLGRVDTPEKIVSGNFDISIVPPLLQKVAGAGWTWEKVPYFKNVCMILSEQRELEAQCCDHFWWVLVIAITGANSLTWPEQTRADHPDYVRINPELPELEQLMRRRCKHSFIYKWFSRQFDNSHPQ